MHLSDRATENIRILRVDVYELTIDGAVAGHDAVRRCFLRSRAEVCAPRRHISADFHETVLIQYLADSPGRRRIIDMTHIATSVIQF